MPVEYKDFLEEADFLLAQVESEIKSRAAISRAYYGLYHLALEYGDATRSVPVSALGGTSHVKLAHYFMEEAGTGQADKVRHRKVGYALQQLHRLRCVADYKLDQDVHRAAAEAALLKCRNIASDIDALFVGAGIAR